MQLDSTQLTQIVGIITATVGGFFFAIFLICATVLSFDWAFRLFKKAFPNARR